METRGLNRLMQPSRGDDPDPRVVVPLLRLYLRRAARWAIAHGREEAWPFFDIAAKVQPERRASVAEVTALEQHLCALHLPSRVVDACVWALHWDQVKDLPAARYFGLPDPFEPLLALFELGGRFTTEHGWIDVSGAAFRLGRLTDHLEGAGNTRPPEGTP